MAFSGSQVTRLGLSGISRGLTGSFFGKAEDGAGKSQDRITRLGLIAIPRGLYGSFAGKTEADGASSGVRRLAVSEYMSRWDQCRQIDWNLPFALAPLDKQEKKLARKARSEGLSVKSGDHDLVLIEKPQDVSKESEPMLIVKKHNRQGKVPLSLIPEMVEEQEIIMILLIE